jgi:hypothetical protein
MHSDYLRAVLEARGGRGKFGSAFVGAERVLLSCQACE